MFFEGNEKKVELVVGPLQGSLRKRGKDFWSRLVEASGARILSQIENERCVAYLLSESSLFVWDDRLTLITCGQTTLVKAVDFFLEHFSPQEIRSLIYERKNEYFPQWQKSDFYQDARELERKLPGKAWQFGNIDEHHVMVYSYNRDFKPPADDFTLEILMYDLQGETFDLFSKPQGCVEALRTKTCVDKILPGFKIDDFLFEPCGYSLNALRSDDYYTIHVTPEDPGMYVSFETNVNLSQDIEPTVKKVVEVFRPRRFDVVMFAPQDVTATAGIFNYHLKAHSHGQISSGYHVSFMQYESPFAKSTKPLEVRL